MRRIKIKKAAAAITFTTVMTMGLFAFPVSANTINTIEFYQTGAGITDAGITLKETTVSGQEIKDWTFSYNNDALTKQEYKLGEVEKTFEPVMKILVFEKGDRTKPVKGTMRMDDTGKYVVNDSLETITYKKQESGVKYEFSINSDNMTPGPKDVVGFILDEPAYNKALADAQAVDAKTFSEAVAAYNASTDPNKEYPDVNDFNTNVKAISEADYYITVSVSIDVTMEATVSTVVTTNSIELCMDSAVADGYEVYREVGTKFIKIATVASDIYTDKGLDANTTYTYKVRPYYCNKTKGETVYGKFSSIDATTAGSCLKLKAKVNSKNKVDLTWKKVNGATKYEIYRVDTTSLSSELSGGERNSFSTKKLIATVKKSKKKYTDKTVTINRSYTYYVRAVLSKNKKIKKDNQRYVEDRAVADISFGSLRNTITKVDKDGSVTLQWDKVYGADGYIVEKKDYIYDKEVAGTKDSPYLCESNVTFYTFINGNYEAKKGSVIYSEDNTSKKKYYHYAIDSSTNIVYEVISLMKYDDATKKTDEIIVVVNKGNSNDTAIPYDKDFEGKELYEYALDEKGLYNVTWSSESVQQADKTYKTTYRITDKRYLYAIDGSNVYACNEKGDIRYTSVPDWKEIIKLAKKTTSYKFAAAATVDPNNKVINTTHYRIKAYKGNTQFGRATEVTTIYTRGVVSKVTAKKAANGIMISWTPVSGASYYKIYRVKTSALEKNKDVGGYDSIYSYNIEDDVFNSPIGTQVVSYVGLENEPKAVDVAAWNKAIDDDIAKSKSEKKNEGYDANNYLKKAQKLNDKISYHYQNYSYEKSVFSDADAAAGILDYAGDIYRGSNSRKTYKTKDDKGQDLAAPVWEYSINPVVKDCDVRESSLKAGVNYTYYVVAFFAKTEEVDDYKGTNVDPKLSDDYWKTLNETKVAYNMTQGPQLKESAYGVSAPVMNFKDEAGFTVGVKTVGKAVFSIKTAAKKPVIKSVKASKGKVTITIKKKVSGADYYKIYRSTKKTGNYISVGVSANAKTTKFVDNSAVKGKTYYYKVVSVVKNEANGEIESAASAIKKVKAK